MKTLKLAAVLAGLCAVVAVILYWDDIIKFIVHPDTLPTGLNLEHYQREIDCRWQGTTGWDEETFLNTHAYCRVCGVEEHNRHLLHTQNADRAAVHIDSAALREWDKPDCNERTIARYVSAIDTVDKYCPNAGTKERTDIRLVLDINETYRNALAFVRSSYRRTPDFSRERNQWTPYSRYANDYKQKRDRLQNDTLLTFHLKNITEIKQGLANVDSKLATAKTVYYRDLAQRMADSYNAIPDTLRTEDDYNRLSAAITQYKTEYSDENAVSGLKALRDKFEYYAAANSLYNEYSRIAPAKRTKEQAKALANKTSVYSGKLPSSSESIKRLQKLEQAFQADVEANEAQANGSSSQPMTARRWKIEK